MRFQILPVLVAASLAMTGAAYAAATTTVGTIKAIDMTAHSITLEDGTVYMLPSGFKDPGLKVGEKISIVWDMVGTAHDATAVTMVK